MPFTKTWNEASPAGADDVAQGDDAIRDFKYAIRERLAVDHYFLDSEAGDAKIGYHKFLTMIDQSTPAAVADAIRLYSKVVSSESELHVIDEDSNEYQLTLNQRLWISALRIASQAQGDILYFNGTIWTRLGAGTSGYYLKTQGTGANPAWTAPPGFPKGYMNGLILSNNGSDVSNDLDISAGVARDDTGAYDITLASAMTKRGDAAFSAGTGQGGGDITGSAGLRYVYLIGKSTDSAAADILLSSSAPGAVSLPSGWDIKRFIGARYWAGSAWALFASNGSSTERWTYLYSHIELVNSGAGVGSTFVDVDCSSYVPDGYGKTVDVLIHASGANAHTVIYARPNGSSEATGAGTEVGGGTSGSGSSGHGSTVLMPLDGSGIFEVATNVGNLYCELRGYKEVL